MLQQGITDIQAKLFVIFLQSGIRRSINEPITATFKTRYYVILSLRNFPHPSDPFGILIPFCIQVHRQRVLPFLNNQDIGIHELLNCCHFVFVNQGHQGGNRNFMFIIDFVSSTSDYCSSAFYSNFTYQTQVKKSQMQHNLHYYCLHLFSQVIRIAQHICKLNL